MYTVMQEEEDEDDKKLVVNCPVWFAPLSMVEKYEAVRPILSKVNKLTCIRFPIGKDFAVFEGAPEAFLAAKAAFVKLKVSRNLYVTSLALEVQGIVVEKKLCLTHSENCNTLPREHLIGCQGIKCSY